MNKTSLSKSDIKRACDILRMDDGVGPTNYIEQLSWLLFLRLFELIELQLKDLGIKDIKLPIIEQDYQWSSWASKDWKDKDELVYFVNQKLFPYLRSLKGTPEKEKVAEIFREITNRIHSPHTVLDTIDILDQIKMSHFQDTHLLSQIYEEILQEMGSEGGWSGEFYTPRPIIRLMIKIVNPKLNEVILDPFVGSAGFLVESFDHLLKDNPNAGVKEYNTLQSKTFYGQEKKPLPYLIGMMNMILHRILVPNLVRTNTLMEDIHNMPESQKVDVILTNPPFGGKENQSVQNNFPIPTQATEGLALQYVMRRLKNGGRCGIILPEGQILFGTGVFQSIREQLLEKFNVTAVIALPQGAFAQMGAGVKTNLVFFEKTGPTKEIWFGEIEGKFTKKKVLQDSDLVTVYDKLINRVASENTWKVTSEELKKRNYDLSAKNPRKVKVDEQRSTKEAINIIEKVNTLISSQSNLLKNKVSDFSLSDGVVWKQIKLVDLVTKITDGTHKTPRYQPDGIPFLSTVNLIPFASDFDYTKYKKFISLEEHRELTKRTKPEKGDLLISKCGTIGRSQIVRVDYEFSIFVGLMLIKLDSGKVNPDYIEFFFNQTYIQRQLQSLSTGATRATLPIRALDNFQIPTPVRNDKPDLYEQVQIVKQLKNIQQSIGSLRGSYESQIENIFKLEQALLGDVFLKKE